MNPSLIRERRRGARFARAASGLEGKRIHSGSPVLQVPLISKGKLGKGYREAAPFSLKERGTWTSESPDKASAPDLRMCGRRSSPSRPALVPAPPA